MVLGVVGNGNQYTVEGMFGSQAEVLSALADEVAEGLDNATSTPDPLAQFGANDLSSATGSPTLGDLGVPKCWLMTDGVGEGVEGMWIVPTGAAGEVTPRFIWGNAGAGAGDVRWRLYYQVTGTGGSFGTSSSSMDKVGTAGAQNVRVTTDFDSTVTVAAGDVVTFTAFRVGGDGSDTLANDAALVGVAFVPLA